MNSNNNNTKWLKNVRPCINNCRTWISWNALIGRYIEVKTGEIHRCPKWRPNSKQQRKTPYKKIRTLKRDEVTYVDTIGPAIAEILSTIEEILKLIRKIHGSIAKFQGDIG